MYISPIKLGLPWVVGPYPGQRNPSVSFKDFLRDFGDLMAPVLLFDPGRYEGADLIFQRKIRVRLKIPMLAHQTVQVRAVDDVSPWKVQRAVSWLTYARENFPHLEEIQKLYEGDPGYDPNRILVEYLENGEVIAKTHAEWEQA